VRLTLWYAGALAIVLGLYAAGVFVFLRHSLSSALDGQLRDDFELAEQMLDRDREGIRWRVDPEHEEGDAAESGRWVEVWRPDGRRLYPRSGSELDTLGPARSVPSKSDAHPWSADVPGVGRVRVFSASYDIGGLPLVLRVARTEEPLRRELGELLMVLGLGVPLALGLTAVGGYWLARRALAPVGHMAIGRARSRPTVSKIDCRWTMRRGNSDSSPSSSTRRSPDWSAPSRSCDASRLMRPTSSARRSPRSGASARWASALAATRPHTERSSAACWS